MPLRLLSKADHRHPLGHRRHPGHAAGGDRRTSVVTGLPDSGGSGHGRSRAGGKASAASPRQWRQPAHPWSGRPRAIVAGRGRALAAGASAIPPGASACRCRSDWARGACSNARRGGSDLSGTSAIVPRSQAFQPGGTRLLSFEPVIDHPPPRRVLAVLEIDVAGLVAAGFLAIAAREDRRPPRRAVPPGEGICEKSHGGPLAPFARRSKQGSAPATRPGRRP